MGNRKPSPISIQDRTLKKIQAYFLSSLPLPVKSTTSCQVYLYVVGETCYIITVTLGEVEACLFIDAVHMFAMYIRVTLNWGYLIILWLFHLGKCCRVFVFTWLWFFNLFCNAWVCVCVGVVMCGCVYVWVCNVWVCVCVGFVMCGCVYVWVL